MGVEQRLLPVPRQQSLDLGYGRFGDAGEDIGKPGLRVDVVELRRIEQCRHEGGAISSTIRSGEQL